MNTLFEMPMTTDAINKRRNFIDTELNRVQKIINTMPDEFIGAVMFKWEPLTQDIKVYTAFFNEHIEAHDWLEAKDDMYKNFNIPISYYYLYKETNDE